MRTSPKKNVAPACIDCGGPMIAARGPHRFTVEGKWSVTLEGVRTYRCKKCGAEEVAIEAPAKLQRTIAAAVIGKKGRLSAEEIVFLQRHLELTARKLAATLGVTPASVSRWANGHEPIGATPDRLLRAVVALHDHGEERFDLNRLADIGEGTGSIRLTLSVGPDGVWHAAA